jgi:hypothetical protein
MDFVLDTEGTINDNSNNKCNTRIVKFNVSKGKVIYWPDCDWNMLEVTVVNVEKTLDVALLANNGTKVSLLADMAYMVIWCCHGRVTWC